MSTVPPSYPPPPPPRTGSTLLAVVLLLLVLILVVSGVVLYLGARYLSHAIKVNVEKPGGRQVSIETPVGSIEVGKDVTEISLGVPIYPGAQRVEGGDSARVHIEIPGAESVHVTAAEFETPDSVEQVREFYRARLGRDDANKEKSTPGETVFQLERKGLEQVVSLKRTASGTRIKIARVRHGQDEAN